MGYINPCQAVINQFLEYCTSVSQVSQFDNLQTKKYSILIGPGNFNFIHMFIDRHKTTMNNVNTLTNGM